MDTPRKTNRTHEEVIKLYERCQRGCTSIQAGEFHICNYATTGIRTGFIPPSDFVNLTDEKMTCLQRRQQIVALLERKEPIMACEYCTIDYTRAIKAAIQAE